MHRHAYQIRNICMDASLKENTTECAVAPTVVHPNNNGNIPANIETNCSRLQRNKRRPKYLDDYVPSTTID